MRPIIRALLVAAAFAAVPLAAPSPAHATACTLSFRCGDELGQGDTLLMESVLNICLLHQDCDDPPVLGWPDFDEI